MVPFPLEGEGQERGQERGANGARETARTRDYYRIEDEAGGRYWVFREGFYGARSEPPPAWYLHGVMG
jgi:protein ImuB